MVPKLAQTDPPIMKSAVGRTIEVTFLYTVPGSETSDRYGFQAKIDGFLPKYALRAGTTEPALVVPFPDSFKESGLRMHYRLEPAISFDVKIRLATQRDKELGIIDISLGGAKLNLPGQIPVELHQNLHLDVYIGEDRYRVMARIQRIVTGPRTGFQQVGVQFVGLDETFHRELNRVIQDHARQQLRHRAGLSTAPRAT
ncbi:MAG: PilZ domain-containing protein [Proteobacteria bacterium]|nr:PilZ domain-containing protein [Pseudomonadota bacterium]